MRISNLFFILFFTTIYSVAEVNINLSEDISDSKLLLLLSKNVKVSEDAYARQHRICINTQESHKLNIDWSLTEGSEENIRKVILNIIYRNIRMCYQKEEKKLIYNLSKLISFKAEKKIDYSKDFNSLCIQAGLTNYIDLYLIKYQKLPLKLRYYFENLIGDKIYDVDKILKQISRHYSSSY